MKHGFICLLLINLSGYSGVNAEQVFRFTAYNNPDHADSIHPTLLAKASADKTDPVSYRAKDINNFPVQELMSRKLASKGALGITKKGRPVDAFYFPGESDRKALVIGGVHGSELSAIEIARNLVTLLEKESRIHYNVVVIPCLFPDNEATALTSKEGAKKMFNNGRYTTKLSVDPNRQMPPLGRSFNDEDPTDYIGRPIEVENQLLLQLINEYKPDRIVNLHAIHNINQAGIFADPRTDYQGYALGFESDSVLAIQMAKFIYERGGNVAGNRLDNSPTALYYNDPAIAPEGEPQSRNMEGAKLPLDRGLGVSLGSWASTAVCDSLHASANRTAMRLITVEFPGYKRPADYSDIKEQAYYKELLGLYVTAMLKYFFAPGLEEQKTDPCLCKGKMPGTDLMSNRN
jgi:hypothetical protein